jgi:hypothetical protein
MTTPAKFAEKHGVKANTMIMVSTRDTIMWTLKLVYVRMTTGTVLAKVTCGTHGHRGRIQSPDI